jgi:hypothetical protein
MDRNHIDIKGEGSHELSSDLSLDTEVGHGSSWEVILFALLFILVFSAVARADLSHSPASSLIAQASLQAVNSDH